MRLNKKKALAKLPLLTWEELDWLEQQCRAHKDNARGPRFYSNRGDGTHQAEGMQALHDHFIGVFDKHHGW